MTKHIKLCASVAVSVLVLQSQATIRTSFDVDDYVQDGLVAFYDGIRNAGADRDHVSDTNRWADLANPGKSAGRATGIGTGNVGAWVDNGYAFAGGSSFGTPAYNLGTEFTIQMVSTLDIPNAKSQLLLRGRADFRCCLVYATESNTHWISGGVAGSAPGSFGPWNGNYWNCAVDSDYIYETHGTSWSSGITPIARTKFDAYDAADFDIGGNKSYTLMNGGVFHALRMYTRKLTDAELAHNRLVDEIRFRGAAIPWMTFTNTVLVASTRADAAGAESGYCRVIGTHAFTASAVSTAANDLQPCGYWLESWDASEGAWKGAEYHEGASCSLGQADSTVPRRLTWDWRVTRGLRTVASYSIGDYVKPGLVANYDGLCNAGAGVAHSMTTNYWRDSSELAHSARLDVSDSSLPGAWTENGYRFEGKSVFRSPSLPSLGLEFTAQLVTDVTVPNSSAMMMVHGKGGVGYAMLWANEDGTHFSANNIAGAWNSSLHGWNGDYWNGALDATKMYKCHGVSWSGSGDSQSANRTVFVEYDAPDFEIGGDVLQNYLMNGVMHAVRFYSRKLTDAELLRNRKVDEARFRGRLFATNVVVAVSRSGYEGTEPPGVYEVEGSWRFTAPQRVVAVGGDSVTLTPYGYTLETFSGGTWSRPVRHIGTYYDHDASGPMVRLKWLVDCGMVIMIK